jgi:hypothetical protein
VLGVFAVEENDHLDEAENIGNKGPLAVRGILAELRPKFRLPVVIIGPSLGLGTRLVSAGGYSWSSTTSRL